MSLEQLVTFLFLVLLTAFQSSLTLQSASLSRALDRFSVMSALMRWARASALSIITQNIVRDGHPVHYQICAFHTWGRREANNAPSHAKNILNNFLKLQQWWYTFMRVENNWPIALIPLLVVWLCHCYNKVIASQQQTLMCWILTKRPWRWELLLYILH